MIYTQWFLLQPDASQGQVVEVWGSVSDSSIQGAAGLMYGAVIGHVTLVAISGTIIQVPYLYVKSLQCIGKLGRWYRSGHGGAAVLLPGFAISW